MPSNSPEESHTGTTLLIGTCRLKRPSKLFDKSTRNHVHVVRSHVHYPAEILQMIRYLRHEVDLDDASLPLVIDDVNTGNLDSHDAIKGRREKNRQALDSSSHVMIEVSSLKRISFLREGEKPYYANITSLSNLSKNRCKSDFIDLDASLDLVEQCKPERYSESAFQDDIEAIVNTLGSRSITLVSHIQATHPVSGELIAERVTSADWLRDAAKRLNCDFYDPTHILNELGESLALKDSSHLSEAGEQAIAAELERMILAHREPHLLSCQQSSNHAA